MAFITLVCDSISDIVLLNATNVSQNAQFRKFEICFLGPPQFQAHLQHTTGYTTPKPTYTDRYDSNSTSRTIKLTNIIYGHLE